MSRKPFTVFAACITLVASTAAFAQEKLEMFSWWTGDGDAGLRALVQKYNSLYPDVAVTNVTATVGPEADARAVLRTRMLVGDPPDTFQARGGEDLFDSWVISNRLEDLSGFYKTQGWGTVFPRDLIALLSTKTGIWSVPLAVNRSNVLWYVPARLSAWGVDPPRTMEGLFAECRKLKDAGVSAPIAVGNASTLIHLWESIAVATLGPDDWSALWTGRLKFTDPRVVRVWDNFGKALEFANTDGADLSWQQAMDRVVEGESAFTYMGDWAESYLVGKLKLTPGEGFAWVPAPGTNGIFVARTDSFSLPKGFKDKASVFKWLMMLGSKEAQDVFNPANGSISPRKDSDAEKYDDYFRSAIKDWRESRIVGSMAHGVAAPRSFVSQFAEVIAIYSATKDPQPAVNAAQGIADQARLGK
jgi:glucose/mannose transport system substrate-binding protein